MRGRQKYLIMLSFCIPFVVLCGASWAEKHNYDSITGKVLTDEEYQKHVDEKTTIYCTIGFEDCDPNEGRRVDGSCNNLLEPARGTAHTPYRRLLPPVYYGDKYEPRKAKTGGELPLSRFVRTSLLAQGRVADKTFTQLVTTFLIFFVSDSFFLQDTMNFVIWRPHCCKKDSTLDKMCMPQEIPPDDPVHRFSGHRCINMTTPVTFQSAGCISNDTVPFKADVSTPFFDLSFIYGSLLNSTMGARLLEGGLLKYETVKGKIWPPSVKDVTRSTCLLGNQDNERRCHDTPHTGSNSILGKSLSTIWFWRQHNRIAFELAELNPAWDDDKLFYTARDINIAIYVQILYYELLPALMGRDNLITDQVISADTDFRDIYNETVIPQTSVEYLYAWRWIHLIQETNVKLYDEKGNYLRIQPSVNLTFRTGWLAKDNNLDYVTQSNFRQPCAKFGDYTVDPDLSEIAFGPVQDVLDILTNDNAKARYFGLQPYIKYKEYCHGKKYNGFEDLSDHIDQENIERLQDVYEDLEDVELMAGLWMERLMEGSFVPPTFYCLVKDHLYLSVVSDRHWYERKDRPNAFTPEQLREIRKSSIAGFLCDVGDSVTEIQPNAFYRTGPGNEMTNCENIARVNITYWKE